MGSGWGTASADYFLPESVLHEVELDIVSTSDCNSASSYDGFVYEDSMICAARGEKGPCHGDNGGPLIIKGADAASDVTLGQEGGTWLVA